MNTKHYFVGYLDSVFCNTPQFFGEVFSYERTKSSKPHDKNTIRKFSAEFETKVVLEVVKGSID
jgi:hypothetical protein